MERTATKSANQMLPTFNILPMAILTVFSLAVIDFTNASGVVGLITQIAIAIWWISRAIIEWRKKLQQDRDIAEGKKENLSTETSDDATD